MIYFFFFHHKYPTKRGAKTAAKKHQTVKIAVLKVLFGSTAARLNASSRAVPKKIAIGTISRGAPMSIARPIIKIWSQYPYHSKLPSPNFQLRRHPFVHSGSVVVSEPGSVEVVFNQFHTAIPKRTINASRRFGLDSKRFQDTANNTKMTTIACIRSVVEAIQVPCRFKSTDPVSRPRHIKNSDTCTSEYIRIRLPMIHSLRLKATNADTIPIVAASALVLAS